MEISESGLEHGDKLLVKIYNGTTFKLCGMPVDRDGDEYENAPEIQLWAGPNTALKKSNFGTYAEVKLMAIGFRKGQLRAKILKSGTLKRFQNDDHQDWVCNLSFKKSDYCSPVPKLPDEGLSIDSTTTTEGQPTEGIDSKHIGTEDEWDTRKSETMDNLPDL